MTIDFTLKELELLEYMAGVLPLVPEAKSAWIKIRKAIKESK